MTTYTSYDVVTQVEQTIPNISSALTGGFILGYTDIVATQLENRLNLSVATGGFDNKFFAPMYWGTLTITYMYEIGVEPTDDISQITIDVITISKNRDRNLTSFRNAQLMYKMSLGELEATSGGQSVFFGNNQRRRSLD